MLNRLFVLSVFALCLSPLVAQNLEIRPQTGLSYSMLNPAPQGAAVNGKISWHAGADVIVGQRLILITGVQYQQFRSGYVYPGALGGKIDLTGERYRVPINIGARLLRKSPKAKINVRVFGGINTYYLASMRSEISSANLNEVTLNEVNPFSVGVNYGVGIDYFRFFAEISRETGVSEFFKDPTKLGQSKTDAFQLNIGLRFRFKNRLIK